MTAICPRCQSTAEITPISAKTTSKALSCRVCGVYYIAPLEVLLSLGTREDMEAAKKVRP